MLITHRSTGGYNGDVGETSKSIDDPITPAVRQHISKVYVLLALTCLCITLGDTLACVTILVSTSAGSCQCMS